MLLALALLPAVLGAGSATPHPACDAALSASCAGQRADAGGCASCAGRHQQPLRLANCSAADIGAFCRPAWRLTSSGR